MCINMELLVNVATASRHEPTWDTRCERCDVHPHSYDVQAFEPVRGEHQILLCQACYEAAQPPVIDLRYQQAAAILARMEPLAGPRCGANQERAAGRHVCWRPLDHDDAHFCFCATAWSS